MNARRNFSDSDQVRAKIVWEVMTMHARLPSHIPGVEVTAEPSRRNRGQGCHERGHV